MSTQLNPQDLTTVRQEVALVTSSLLPKVTALVVQCEDDYIVADTYLSRIRTVRANIKARIDKILKPLNEARAEVHSLSHDLDDPLEKAELRVRAGMKQFELEKVRKERAVVEERQAEARRQQQIADEARHSAEIAERAAQASRNTAKLKLAQAAQEQARLAQKLAERAQIVADRVEVAEPLRVAGSSSKVVQVAKVGDVVEFLAGVVTGDIPATLVKVDEVMLKRLYAANPEEVGKWPGVVVVDDVDLRGKARR